MEAPLFLVGASAGLRRVGENPNEGCKLPATLRADALAKEGLKERAEDLPLA